MSSRTAAGMILIGLVFLGLTIATFLATWDHDIAQAFGLVGAALALFFLGDGVLQLWRVRRLREFGPRDNR